MKTRFSFSMNTALLYKIAVFTFVVLYSVSCTHRDQDHPDNDYPSQLHIGGEKIDITNTYSYDSREKGVNPKNLKLTQLKGDITSTAANRVMDGLRSYFQGEILERSKKVKYITFFTNKSSSYIQYKDIQGISLFAIDNDKLVHRLYNVKNGAFEEDKRFSLTTDYFMCDEINLLANAAYGDLTMKWTMLTVSNSTNNKNARVGALRVNKIDRMTGVLKTYAVNSSYPPAPSDGCSSCGGGAGNCTSDAFGTYCCDSCDPGICNQQTVNRIQQQLSKAQLSDSVSYRVRNQFMALSSIGQKYRDYYYAVSAVAAQNDAITTSTVADHYNLGLTVQNVAVKMMNGGPANEILVSKAIRNQVLDMLSYYAQFNEDDGDYQQMIVDMQNDIVFFSNKTRTQINQTYPNLAKIN